jgi:SDR family mycofactocin-dependent oxidoreductase
MGRVDGKTALVTGAARGQGRAHALRLAEEGANLILADACTDFASVQYSMGSEDDLKETAELVRELGRLVHCQRADVRSYGDMQAVVQRGEDEFGHIDIVCANAGIVSYAKAWEFTAEQWQDMLDVNLTGVWHTVKAAVPGMIRHGSGGSIIITSSLAGQMAYANSAGYVASKHGVTGLAKALALDLGAYGIRVNTLHPSCVDTPMIHNQSTYHLFSPDIQGHIDREDFDRVARGLNVLPIPYVEPRDVSEAVLWLGSDESRYVTGAALPIDAGAALM